MKRVTGIGGIFFTAKDPVALGAWYKKYLGIDMQDWGGAAFRWAFMVNYRVADLHSLLRSRTKISTHGTFIARTDTKVPPVPAAHINRRLARKPLHRSPALARRLA